MSLDFVSISAKSKKRGVVEIYPKFIIKKSEDLMIRGGDFYAIWLEDKNLWSTDEQDVIRLIDREIDIFCNEHKASFVDQQVIRLYMWDATTGMIDVWHKYCQRQMRDNFVTLDEKLIFSNTKVTKKDYASKKLSYPLEPCDISAYNKLISTLYSEEERRKIEWAIGAVVSGDSKTIQKFVALYGSAGTGKSTVLNIIQALFDGYCSVFDAKALGSSSNAFALEAFRSNPLVAIQHDGDLSHIEDNTKLNSLVSHEMMTVNEKFKATYSNRFKSFLFIGTNKPVRITDAKSGLIRRLIDISPTGNKVKFSEYKKLMEEISFELGGIASHCLDVYNQDPSYYDDYIPSLMMAASNDFYNFVLDSFYIFDENDSVTLKVAYEMYKTYCEEAKVSYPFSRRIFSEELKNYFKEYKDRATLEDGSRVRSLYSKFKREIFEIQIPENSQGEKSEKVSDSWLNFKEQASTFDAVACGYLAQYASEGGTPLQTWSKVKTILSDLDTSRLHYVKFNKEHQNHIVIDFDCKDENGDKSLEENIKQASKWPKTYAELSKSGCGIHLHYIYSGGDPKELSRIYDENIEIKVFTGKASLRRQLTKCNSLPIAIINSGLPRKEEKKMISFDGIANEKAIRTMIFKNLNKEYHGYTKPSIDYIVKILDDAYNSGVKYDVSDLRNKILTFAMKSTNNKEYCVKQISKMKFKSDEPSENKEFGNEKMIFFDIECFPNLFYIGWKFEGDKEPIHRMYNPTASEIEDILKYRLVGFNNRRYDNHMIYARLIGYSIETMYKQSQAIINNKPNCFFSEAYNLSYTDIYDFASAGNKKSLKKLEIEMGIHHQELGLPWDQPVDPSLWEKVAEYCDNDVVATEAAFHYLASDFEARQILAELAGGTVNDTTNSLSTRFIFGKDKSPQKYFQYRDLSKPVTENDISPDVLEFLKEAKPEMLEHKFKGPLGESILPYFPGYKYESGVSSYKTVEKVGEGGRVESTPGAYYYVGLFDVESMHPNTIVSECLFGPKYTRRFKDILDARLAIKHEDWDKARSLMGGELSKFIDKILSGSVKPKALANALKTVINSIYGLTSASFDNAFRDIRNKDNIVAKRGALFMIDLAEYVRSKGYQVIHVKTDSIKVPNVDDTIAKEIMAFGKKYGYTFDWEDTYERIALVNDAVYIAKTMDGKWSATGTQFAVPYVFKTLFSKEDIFFYDLCETKSVKSSIYLDMNEDLEDVSELEALRDKEMKKGTYTGLYDEKIANGHNYIFVGRVGQFCPVRPYFGGGELVWEQTTKDGKKKFNAVNGTKGYRWLESETVKKMENWKDVIDMGYYHNLVTEAINTIEQYESFDTFMAIDIPPWGNELS